MFSGQSIYYADRFTKAAGHCLLAATDRPEFGFIFAAVVSCGKHLEKGTDDFNLGDSVNCDSVEGLRRYKPRKLIPGATSSYKIPSTVTQRNYKVLSTSPLYYNEYVIYNAARSKLEYLMEVKFLYN